MGDRTRPEFSGSIERAPALSDQTLELLRSAITLGHVGPGDKLSEREVADWFGTSRAPVHDALVVLENEGILTLRSDGRYVAELSFEAIHEYFSVRRVLERYAVQEACRNMTPSALAELAARVDAIEEAIRDEDGARYSLEDLAMHRLLWDAAGNRQLRRLLESTVAPIYVARQSDGYRAYEASLNETGDVLDDPDDVLANLRELLRNLERRDCAAAEHNIIRDLARAWRRRKVSKDVRH